MPKFYEFESSGLRLDAETGRLWTSDGAQVDLRPQTREVLSLLARAPGRTVTKAEFSDAVWEGRTVSDDSLVQCIREIRAALNEDGPSIIRTVPRKGYQFIPPGAPGPAAGVPARLLAAAVFGVTVLATVTLWMSLASRPDDQMETIAVLPLEDLSPEPFRGYLSDALGEGVITELARSPHFRVLARNSSFQFRDAPTDIREIGDTLGADYIVEGSQQFDGKKIRVTVQLIEARTGSHIFSDQIERDLGDLFVVQNMIVRQVTAAIGETLMLDMPLQASRGDVDARLRGLQARKLATHLTRENWEKALALEEQSIREEPGSAWGYIGKSMMLANGAEMRWLEPKEHVLAEAANLARTALELAPENYMSHYALGRVLTRLGRYDESILQFERAAELNPSDPIVWIAMAVPLRFTGHADRSLNVLELAARVDPMHGDWLRAEFALTHWQRNACRAGIRSIQSMSQRSDYVFPIHIALLVCLDRLDEAQETLTVYLSRNPDYSLARARAELPATWLPEGTTERWITSLKRAGLE